MVGTTDNPIQIGKKSNYILVLFLDVQSEYC